jgi:hypothetical protein
VVSAHGAGVTNCGANVAAVNLSTICRIGKGTGRSPSLPSPACGEGREGPASRAVLTISAAVGTAREALKSKGAVPGDFAHPATMARPYDRDPS